MRKTLDRLMLIGHVRGEAGLAMRQFIRGEINRDQLLGSLKSLFSIEASYADMISEKHEIVPVLVVVREHIKAELPEDLTKTDVLLFFQKTRAFGDYY
ncbi:MAG: hypothetical protein ABS894_00775 [Aerococcus urinaeequi]